MLRGVYLSIILHLLLLGGLIYSNELSLLLFRSTQKKLENLGGAIQVDLTYKASDTAMKLGPKGKDLPPPDVAPKVAKAEEVSKIVKDRPETRPKTKPKDPKQTALAKKKDELKDILKRLKIEARKEDDRPAPKEDNYPTNEKGEKDARGTGGRATRTLSPAEQALNQAVKKYYEFPEAPSIRRNFPNAKGFMSVKLIGSGHQFRIVSMSIVQSSGVSVLDQQCKLALQQAVANETFASDVISELSGKERIVVCQI